jgi:hypothetical protein
MFFRVKNGPPTFQRVMTKIVLKYLNSFMKIFLDDFIVYIVIWRFLTKV